MKAGKAGIWLGIASACLVITLALVVSQETSPGDISAVHAISAGIEGDDCALCHGDSPSELRGACAACHAAIEAQVANATGFHGGLRDPGRCGACHSEHHGAEFELAGAGAFALAGVPDRAAYAHEALGFELGGDHTSGLACRACHEHADSALLPKGAHRFLGESQACASCHDDPHQGRLPDCRSCHGETEPFELVAEFEHPSTFALVGVHAKASCIDCHAPGTAYAIEAGGSETSTRPARACDACHASPHSAPFVEAVAVRLAAQGVAARLDAQGVAARLDAHSDVAARLDAQGNVAARLAAQGNDAARLDAQGTVAARLDAHDVDPARLDAPVGSACAACHPLDGGPFTRALPLAAADHAASGFPLTLPHDKAACTDCHARLDPAPGHAGAFADYRAAHPGRGPEDCAACHADPHGGQFDVGAYATDGCLACHARESFDPQHFGVAEHARTDFALTGRHADAACESCHAQVGNAPRQFRDTDTRCSACHTDAHAGFFARSAIDDAAQARADDCATCHTTTSFAVLASAEFDHTRWTGYELVGAHARSECATCHGARATPDERGRSFGVVAETFPGSRDDCATCHVDAHGGFFERQPSAPACAACHDPHAFEAAADDFDHARWTGFVLEGAHARATCATCHATAAISASESAPLAAPSAVRVTLHAGQGSFQDCATCHVDVHAGAFDGPGRPRNVTGRAGCARCHSTESFDELLPGGFDHATWTGFELMGAHARAECASCHPRERDAPPDARSFARAAGTRCQDCHSDPHAGQFAREAVTDCAACHATAPDFLALDFDHQRDSRFALDTTHARLECSACHVPWPLPGGGTAVRYKPLGVVCGDCHDARGGLRK